MKIIVVGCGRIGAELAYSLFKRGHQVSVVDDNVNSFNNLPPDFEGKHQEGDAMNQDVLLRAGIQTCDALAAVTNNDTLNAVISHIAKIEFNVPNIVARNYDPHLRPVFEAFNIQIISSTSWGAQRIQELLLDPSFRSIFSAGNGEVEIYEMLIPPTWDGKLLGDLLRDNPDCLPVALTRAGRALLPNTETALQSGDMLNISATFAGIKVLRSRMDSGAEV